nr:hypothetical protein [Clostridia bacterium]
MSETMKKGMMSMPADIAFDKMEKLLPYLSEVLNDADVKAFRDAAGTTETANMPAGDAMQQLLPLFVTKHREAMFNIIAVFKGVTVDEAREMPLSDVLKVMKENFVGDMLVFFIFCLRMVSVR